MRIIGVCPLCHSEQRDRGRRTRCDNDTCRGWTDEQWALETAAAAFAADEIDIAELEHRIDVALTDPPRAARTATIFM